MREYVSDNMHCILRAIFKQEHQGPGALSNSPEQPDDTESKPSKIFLWSLSPSSNNASQVTVVAVVAAEYGETEVFEADKWNVKLRFRISLSLSPI